MFVCSWVKLTVHEACLFSPTALCFRLMQRDSCAKLVDVVRRREEGEVTYRCLPPMGFWGLSDSMPCSLIHSPVWEQTSAGAPVCDESVCNSCGCKAQYTVKPYVLQGPIQFCSAFNIKHNKVFKWIWMIIILYWYSLHLLNRECIGCLILQIHSRSRKINL